MTDGPNWQLMAAAGIWLVACMTVLFAVLVDIGDWLEHWLGDGEEE